MDKLKTLFKLEVKPLTLIRHYIILLGGGCILLALVYCIPEERIRRHIEISSDFIVEEGNYPYMGVESGGFILDNYTEALLLMFNYTADNAKPIYNAFVAQEYCKQGTEGVDLFQEMLLDSEWEQAIAGKRSSNWLGMNIVLRPLLFMFDFSQCRVILNVISYLALFVTMVLMARKCGGGYLAIGFGFTLMAFNYYSLSLSFSLGVFCVIIACAAICFMLIRGLSKVNLLQVMFVVGIATAYFDWLSIPLITWGLPILVVLAMMYSQNNNTLFVEYFNKAFQGGFGWSLGYAGMIIGKCMVAVLVQGKGAISFFLNRVTADTKIRSAQDFGMSIRRLFNCFFPFNLRPGNNVYFVLLLLAAAMLVVTVLLVNRERRRLAAVVIMVGLSPFLYYVYVGGHVHHTGIEFRSLMISFFAIWIVMQPFYDIIHRRIKKL
ncbi:MAG: hypothetical protein NC121_04450 [Blautia sp.]|nr:hypothetical protein [Blautia sp.]